MPASSGLGMSLCGVVLTRQDYSSISHQDGMTASQAWVCHYVVLCLPDRITLLYPTRMAWLLPRPGYVTMWCCAHQAGLLFNIPPGWHDCFPGLGMLPGDVVWTRQEYSSISHQAGYVTMWCCAHQTGLLFIFPQG